MSEEKVKIKEWFEKNKFDANHCFEITKKLDGVSSIMSKVSVSDLENLRSEFEVAQKKVPHNKGKRNVSESAVKKAVKTEGVTLKKINKPVKVTVPKVEPIKKIKEPIVPEPPSKTKHVEPVELPKEPPKAPVVTPVVVKAPPEPPREAEPLPQIAENLFKDSDKPKAKKEEEPKKEEKLDLPPPVVEAELPKKAAFTAKIFNVDQNALARIQKSRQERDNRASNPQFRNNFGQKRNDKFQPGQKTQGGNRQTPTSSAGYSGNLRAPLRQTENRATAGGSQHRAFGTKLQDIVSANAGQKTFMDNNKSSRGNHGDFYKDKGKNKKGKDSQREREMQKENVESAQRRVDSVLVSLSKTPVKKVYNKDKVRNEDEAELKIINVSAIISVGELAGLLEIAPARVIGKCMEMGNMVTINHNLDFDTVQILADEFGYEARLMEEYQDDVLGIEEEDEGDKRTRHPVVTVMGHVDHGKTSLLDYIRKTNVVRGESGGITQHIGAYEVETPAGKITFLDTPGHEAFTAMRARGSQITDVIVLVIAADSMIMPQTLEVIDLAKNANVPIVVAITKIDLPTANSDKIKAQLSERGVQVEEWGGSVSCVEISVKTGVGIDKLLETLALESEVLELKANPDSKAKGAVVESRLDAGKGTIATILVQNGTLRIRDCFVCGNYSGRVRALFNEHGETLKEAGPSTPCQVLGFTGTPQAGDDLVVVESDQIASEIATKRQHAAHERALRFKAHMSLEQVYDRAKSGDFSELNLLIKTDVAGSCEALAESLHSLTNNEVKIKIVRKGVGAINDDDIHLASISNAIIIAFHLMPSQSIREVAEQEGVEIKTYRIIYDVIEEVKGAIEGLLKPTSKEEVAGEAEIRQIFRIPKIGLIAGCMVKSGEVNRESQVRVYRDGVELGVTKIQSLKRVKDDVSSVKAGMECGIGLRGYENIQEGDYLIFFKQVSVARTLGDVAKDEK